MKTLEEHHTAMGVVLDNWSAELERGSDESKRLRMAEQAIAVLYEAVSDLITQLVQKEMQNGFDKKDTRRDESPWRVPGLYSTASEGRDNIRSSDEAIPQHDDSGMGTNA